MEKFDGAWAQVDDIDGLFGGYVEELKQPKQVHAEPKEKARAAFHKLFASRSAVTYQTPTKHAAKTTMPSPSTHATPGSVRTPATNTATSTPTSPTTHAFAGDTPAKSDEVLETDNEECGKDVDDTDIQALMRIADKWDVTSSECSQGGEVAGSEAASSASEHDSQATPLPGSPRSRSRSPRRKEPSPPPVRADRFLAVGAHARPVPPPPPAVPQDVRWWHDRVWQAVVGLRIRLPAEATTRYRTEHLCAGMGTDGEALQAIYLAHTHHQSSRGGAKRQTAKQQQVKADGQVHR